MRTFAEFATVRTELLAECGRLTDVWADVQSFQKDAEGQAGDHDDSGDVVRDAVAQVRRRLQHSMLEIGVFGEVKRGKSTLLNALLAREVSSMRVTPETAVPVWVERGHEEAIVLYADGRTEVTDDLDEAKERMSQRFRRKRPAEPVTRVVQRVEVEWLPEGVRIVDTPGLADPSLAEDYEALTLSELDRVAAAVFVFVSPPGIASEEERLLRSLAARGVEKLFLVCNFYPDHWADPAAREKVADHIRQTLGGHERDGVLEQDRVQVFEVNAREGLTAALRGDEDGLEASGVATLRRELERYLADTAMERLVARCRGYLGRARSTMLTVLDARVESLQDRSELVAAKKRLDADIRTSKEALREIEDTCVRDVAELRGRLEKIVTAPFGQADDLISKANSTRDLEGIQHKLQLAAETAANRASAAIRTEVSVLEERVRSRLYETFGIDDDLRTSSRSGELDPVSSSLQVGLVEGQADASAVGLGAGVGGTAGALVGGSLAGGLGIALIASGPVGWLVGAGLGALAGGALGGGIGGLLTRDSIDSTTREELRGQLLEGRSHASDQVRVRCSQIQDELMGAVSRQRENFFSDRAAELARIEGILSDRTAVDQALAEARQLRARVEGR